MGTPVKGDEAWSADPDEWKGREWSEDLDYNNTPTGLTNFVGLVSPFLGRRTPNVTTEARPFHARLMNAWERVVWWVDRVQWRRCP